MLRVDWTEVDARPYHLQLERESAEFYIVTDRWNPDTVMMRSADADLCRRFMAAFVTKEPGSTMQAYAQEFYSWRVAQDSTLSEREGLPGSRRDGTGASPGASPRSENVYPPAPEPTPNVGLPEVRRGNVFRIRPHEQLDEVS